MTSKERHENYKLDSLLNPLPDPPSPAPDNSTTLPAGPGNSVLRNAVQTIVQNHPKSLLYITLSTILFRLLCGWAGCSNCGDLTYALSTALAIAYTGAMQYMGELRF